MYIYLTTAPAPMHLPLYLHLWVQLNGSIRAIQREANNNTWVGSEWVVSFINILI